MSSRNSLFPPASTITSIFRSQGITGRDVSIFSGHMAISTRILGVQPNVFPVLSLSPSVLRMQFSLHPPLFNAPAVDFRLPNTLSPALRRVAFHSAVATSGCTYCAAHALVMGDLLLGSMSAQGLPAEIRSQDSALAREAVDKFATAAAKRPVSRAAIEELKLLAAEVENHTSQDQLKTVKTVVAMSGFLSTNVMAVGAELEPEIEQLIEKAYTDPGHAQGFIGNALALGRLAGSAVSAKYVDETVLLNGIPRNTDAIVQWAAMRLGADHAQFLGNIGRVDVQRAFCAALREALFVEEERSGKRYWTHTQRARFLETFADTTKSAHLKEVAQRLREWSRETESVHLEDLNKENAANAFVAASAEGNFTNVTEDVVLRLCNVCDMEAVIEVVGVTAFCEMWRRMSLLFSL